jgi:peroxidase
VWLREHNRIAGLILEKRPSWSDEQIYQETRRIVIAQMQNIVYGEYLTVLLGTPAMSRYDLTLDNQFSFYDASVDATIFNAFATAA